MAASRKRPIQKKWLILRNLRRTSQTIFLVLFLWLIGLTAQVTGGSVDAEGAVDVPYPVEAFLDIDPLAGAIVLLSTGTIPAPMIFGLITLATGFLLGRAFCGWVCPLGTMNHMMSEVAKSLRGKRLIEANRTRPYQKIKYLVLIVTLAAALFGSAIGGLLDPICLATRGIALTLLPWLAWSANGIIEAAMASNVLSLQKAADGFYEVASGFLLYQGGLVVSGGLVLSVVFLAVLLANRLIPRFWCRGICPLGALLGLLGRFGILSLRKNDTACDQCGKCQLHCSGAASPRPGESWERAECDLCLNCVATCPHDALDMGPVGSPAPENSAPELGRRRLLTSAAAGAVLVPAMRTGSLVSTEGRPDPACIRPPGALDEPDFLNRCIRCGQCMKICPNNALHPAVDEGGIEGFWTPVLVPKIGYCEPTCTLCTQVCPTGAIRQVTESQKVGDNGEKMIRLGTAFIERGRCLPWATGTPCIVCEEFCPVSPKAIWFENTETVVRGQQKSLKLPHVDPIECNGCGACEHVCPVHDQAAIRVSAAGESRSPAHELLLQRRKT